jgi:hypothetical protein
MRYHVTAKLKPGKRAATETAITRGTLGRGSVAGGEYIRDMRTARVMEDKTVQWIEVCYCTVPLEEERPYWEPYFDLLSVVDAHGRRACKHENGREPWSCGDCTCAQELEQSLAAAGKPFLETLRA